MRCRPPRIPRRKLEAAHDRALAHEFAATLDEHERRILRAKYDADGAAPIGYKVIARQLGISIGAVRSAERSIERKVERFAAVYSAGRLCDVRAVAITSLAAGTADPQQARVARAHVEHCGHCRPHFATQLRELSSAAFERKVAALLPVGEISDRHRIRGTWDALGDWITRPFFHEPTATAAQLAASGAGRGAGTIAFLKIAGACVTSAGALGLCATTIIAPAIQNDSATRRAAPHKADREKPSVGEHTRVPTRVEQQLVPMPTPASPQRPTTKPRQAGRSGTQGGTGPASHEKKPASRAPSNAAAGGASEFDPNYQPDRTSDARSGARRTRRRRVLLTPRRRPPAMHSLTRTDRSTRKAALIGVAILLAIVGHS